MQRSSVISCNVQFLRSTLEIFELTITVLLFTFWLQQFIQESDANADAKVTFNEFYAALLKANGFQEAEVVPPQPQVYPGKHCFTLYDVPSST